MRMDGADKKFVVIVVVGFLMCVHARLFPGSRLSQLSSAFASVKSAGQSVGSQFKGIGTSLGESFGDVPSDYYYNAVCINDSCVPLHAYQQHVTGVMGAKFSGSISRSTALAPYTDSGWNINNVQGGQAPTFQHCGIYCGMYLKANPGDFDKTDAFGHKLQDLGGAQSFFASMGMGHVDALVQRQVGLEIGKNNNNWYFYRAYDLVPVKQQTGTTFSSQNISEEQDTQYATYQLAGEYLGNCVMGAQFLGSISSGASQNTLLEFVRDNKLYTVTLEPRSTNMLQDSAAAANSMRPQWGSSAWFKVFSADGKKTLLAQIPITPYGVMIPPAAAQAGQAAQPATPMSYSYGFVEPVPGKFVMGMEGLAVGNYTLPLNDRIRDINPVPCMIWNISAAQQAVEDAAADKQDNEQPTYEQISVDLGYEEVWAYYQSADCTIARHIPYGSYVSLELIRPRLSEQKAWLFVVALRRMTSNANVPLFLKRIADGAIGQSALYGANDLSMQTLSSVSTLGNTQAGTMPLLNVNSLISSLAPQDTGTIDDVAVSGIGGYILTADIFTPLGLPANTVFYYKVGPSTLMLQSLCNTLVAYLPQAAQATALQSLATPASSAPNAQSLVQQWIDQYPTSPAAVQTAVAAYLQNQGATQLLAPTSTQHTPVLNATGQMVVKQFLQGPVSIVSPPIWRSSGTNCYINSYGQKPKDWPGTSALAPEPAAATASSSAASATGTVSAR